MKEKIAVIGGGIGGITTAITLQLFGFDTVCYAKQLVGNEPDGNPLFASQYPAASVIPHSVYSDDLKHLFPASQSVFEKLYEFGAFHVAKHRHFELFEFEKELPDYIAELYNCTQIHESNEKHLPQRRDAPALNGWAFDCFVAEWPSYIHRLYQFYRQLGGDIQQQKIKREEIVNLSAGIIINCAGVGALKLADDSASAQLIRGHMVHLHDRPLVRNESGQIVSYNYTPELQTYSTGGRPSDVYFYPVNGQWIFGGSRQFGTLDEEGNWQGEGYPDMININGCEVPRPIVTLNRDILSNSFGITPDFSGDVRIDIGYRFIRKDEEPGLRIEPDETGDKLMIHNYGHGGAGVTLSWGCALKILQIIEHKGVKLSLDNQLRNQMEGAQIKSRLQKVYSNYFL